MASLDTIVQVYITRETQQIDTASFDKPLLYVSLPDVSGSPADVSVRVRTYTSLTDIATDYTTNSDAYRMAAKVLGGTQRPNTIYIGVKNSAESWATGLAAIIEASNQWYILTAATKNSSDIQAMAAIIEAQKKMYFASTADAAVISPTSTTDVGYLLSAANYDRTVLVYSPNAATEHPECAWIGTQMVEVPGSNTWAFKTANGITGTKLSGTAEAALKAKNVNYFTSVAGVDIFLNGVTAKGSWIDELIFIDWCYARIQEQVFYRIINKKKIPVAQAGATIIGAEIRSVLAQGVANGGIADTPPFKVFEPDVLAIPETQRSQRILGDFKFEFRLAGAAHSVIVRGVAGV